MSERQKFIELRGHFYRRYSGEVVFYQFTSHEAGDYPAVVRIPIPDAVFVDQEPLQVEAEVELTAKEESA